MLDRLLEMKLLNRSHYTSHGHATLDVPQLLIKHTYNLRGLAFSSINRGIFCQA